MPDQRQAMLRYLMSQAGGRRPGITLPDDPATPPVPQRSFPGQNNTPGHWDSYERNPTESTPDRVQRQAQNNVRQQNLTQLLRWRRNNPDPYLKKTLNMDVRPQSGIPQTLFQDTGVGDEREQAFIKYLRGY